MKRLTSRLNLHGGHLLDCASENCHSILGRVQGSFPRDIRWQLGPFSVACFLTGFVLTSPNSLLQQYFLLVSGMYFWKSLHFQMSLNGEPTFFVSIQSLQNTPFCFLLVTLTDFLHLGLHCSLLKAACSVGGSHGYSLVIGSIIVSSVYDSDWLVSCFL